MSGTDNLAWWSGVTEILATGMAEGSVRIERAHLAIADESFNLLARIPLTRPVSEPVRLLHHGISRLSYRSVALAGRGLGHLATSLRPSQMKLITQNSPTLPITRV